MSVKLKLSWADAQALIILGKEPDSGAKPMSTVKSLGIDMLSRDERIELVQAIWDTIAAEQSPPFLNEEQRQELKRRIAEDDASPDDAIPWEQVKAQTLAKFQQ